MAVDLIESYIRRDGIEDDTDFLLKELNKALGALEKLDKHKLDLKASKSLNAAGEAAGKLKVQMDELQKIEQQVIKTYEKRQAQGAQTAKDLTAEKELLRQKNLELRNTVKENLAVENSIDQMRAKLNLLTQKKNTLNIDTKEYKDAEKEVLNLTNKLKALEAASGDHRRNVGNYSAAMKTLEGALADVRRKMDDFNKSGETSETILETLNREEALLSQLVNTQANGFASATAELKNNEKALQALSNAGLQATDFYKALLKQTAELKDNVGDLKQEIKNLASDTSTLDGLIQGAETLAGVYGIAQGTAALFGDENEELQKTMVKLQSVMVILNGLQAVRNALQSQSSLILLASTVRTTALAAATRVYTFVTGGATAAARTFNAVLVASTIGIVITLLATAASAMGIFGDETEETTNSIKEQEAAMEALNKQNLEYADASEKRRNAIKGGLDDLKREMQLQEASGASDSKRFETKQAILALELENIRVRRRSIEEDGKLELEFDKEIADKKNEIAAERLAYEKSISDKNKDQLKKDSEERLANSKAYAEKERKAQFDLLKITIQDKINAEKALSEDNGLNNEGSRIKARMEAFEQEVKLIEAEKQFALNAENVTATERLVIIKDAAIKIKAIEKETANDIIAIRASVAARAKEDADDIMANAKAAQESQLSGDVGREEANFTKAIRRLEEKADAEQKINTANYTAGKISKEQYEKEKIAIENRFRQEALQAEIEYNQKLLQIVDLSPETKAAAEQKLYELQRQLRALGLKEEEAAADESIEIHRKKNEALKQLGTELKETVFSFLVSGIEKEKNAIQEQITALDVKKAKEIEVANQTITSATERAAAISIIEARAAAEKESLERRKRQLDEQRARFERSKNIGEIIGNTARAVAAALPNIPLSIIVGAIGAAQLVRAITAPIPKFFKGKDKHNNYEGPGIVGDGGKQEAILREDGTVEITPNRPTLTYVKKNDIILPDARQLMQMQMQMAIDRTGRLVHGNLPQQQPNNKNLEREIKKLGSRFENAVRSMPQPQFTKDGLAGWVRSSDSIEYINKYR